MLARDVLISHVSGKIEATQNTASGEKSDIGP
jgi:hypothetical protein